MNSRLKVSDGSITVEAAIVLPLFICVILTFGFLIKIFYVHEILQHAITETANEMSASSYIYYVGGLYDLQKEIDIGLENRAGDYEDKLEKVEVLLESFRETNSKLSNTKNITTQGINTFKNHIKELEFRQGLDSIFDTFDTLRSSMKDIEELVVQVNDIKDVLQHSLLNPEKELNNILAIMGKEAWKDSKTLLGNLIVRQVIEKYIITTEEADINKRLLRLNIVNGWRGIDFTESRFLEGNQDIEITIKYQIEIPLPINLIGTIPIKQKATIRAWMGGDSMGLPQLVKRSKLPEDLVDEVIDAGYDIWALQVFDRGREIKRMLGTNIDEDFPIVDKLSEGVITSIRTHDTRLRSNQGNSFTRQLQEDLRRIVDFTERSFKGTTIGRSDYNGKELNLVFPDVELTEEQISYLYEFLGIAKAKAIKVKITVIR